MVDRNSESWLPVIGWEGLYEVSDLGRVRSVRRRTVDRNGYARTYPAHILKFSQGKGGYLRATMTRPGVRVQSLVHRLVLMAFVGRPPAGHEGCHGPSGSGDNRLVNLRWDTRSENNIDSIRNGTNSRAAKTRCLWKHRLSGRNVYETPTVHGRPRRSCLSCRHGQTAVSNAKKYGRPIPDRHFVADEYYATLGLE